MNARIESAKRFNSSLIESNLTSKELNQTNKESESTMINKESKANKLIRIQNVLKEKGMDSQQQVQAMERISEILS